MSLETGEQKPGDVWKAQQRFIGRYGNMALKNPVAEPPEDSWLRYNSSKLSKYERLAHDYFRQFLAALKTRGDHEPSSNDPVDSTPIAYGYMIMGRILDHLVTAYSVFCAKTDRPGSVRELAELVGNEQVYGEFVTYLSSLPKQINSIFEENYSLNDSGFQSAKRVGAGVFVIDERPSGELFAYPQSLLEAQAMAGIPQRTAGSYGEYARCPATDVLLRNLWDNMVQTSVTDPELFAADLGIEVE